MAATLVESLGLIDVRQLMRGLPWAGDWTAVTEEILAFAGQAGAARKWTQPPGRRGQAVMEREKRMADTPVTNASRDLARRAVAELVPDFRARAGEGEQLRTMPIDLVRRAKAAGLFRLNLPESLGGLELDPATTVEIVEEISRADGSAGWTIVIGNSTAFFAWLDPSVARELIGAHPDFVSTSVWAPLGRAAPERPGRFTVSGRWPFNSGCPHADWLQVGVFVSDSGAPRTLASGAPDWRFAFIPARSAVIEDTWDAMGLRGTGSHHLTVSDASVPAEHLAAPFFESARHDGPLWRIPLVTLAGMFLAAVPLGIARRALDEFAALAMTKVRGPTTQGIGHDAEAQGQLARAEGALAAARSFLFDAIAGIWDTACRGDEPGLEQRALVLLAASQVVRAGVEAVDRVFRLAGAEAVFAVHPLQRCFRDIHTASQHILFSTGRDQAFAKVRLGIEQPTFLI
jgi:alkylation response protein AidB-like acyl-CoA dehydrogenase